MRVLYQIFKLSFVCTKPFVRTQLRTSQVAVETCRKKWVSRWATWRTSGFQLEQSERKKTGIFLRRRALGYIISAGPQASVVCWRLLHLLPSPTTSVRRRELAFICLILFAYNPHAPSFFISLFICLSVSPLTSFLIESSTSQNRSSIYLHKFGIISPTASILR